MHTKRAFKMNSNRQNFLLIAGAGKPAFGKKEVLLAEKALLNQGTEVKRIGDGTTSLTGADVEAILEYVRTSEKNLTIVIMAHGDKEGNLDLTGEFTTSGFELLERIAKASHGRKIDIFSTACYGGVLQRKASQVLLEDCSYVALSPTEKGISGVNIDTLWAYLAEHNLSCCTAESMLIVYLVAAMKLRYAPSITKKHLTYDLDEQLDRDCRL